MEKREHPTSVRSFGRRSFFQRSAVVAGGFALAGPLRALMARADNESESERLSTTPDYGPLFPTQDRNTGLFLLRLPRGFQYTTFGWVGDPLSNGTPTPGLHDGMAVARVQRSSVWLIRNHEVRAEGPGGTAFDNRPEITYDPVAGGGTTNLLFNIRTGQVERAEASIVGTSTNCAGGPTPWGSWLTCEETLIDQDSVDSNGNNLGLQQTHGWVFDVPSTRPAIPEPLRDMGRFVHEAVVVDPVTGYVYETEDQRQASGFYRFIPNTFGDLSRGGKLQMLRIAGQDQADLTGNVAVGIVFNVNWVDIDDPESLDPSVYQQGLAKGGATFDRLEGCWYGNGLIYFAATEGGDPGSGESGFGHIWEYDPVAEQLQLIFQSPDRNTLDNPDNLAVSPRGGIVLCEDGELEGQRLQGLTPDGRIFPFAQNDVVLNGERNGIVGDFRDREWAGATFFGRWLFVNIQTPGITFAITGPWELGSL